MAHTTGQESTTAPTGTNQVPTFHADNSGTTNDPYLDIQIVSGTPWSFVGTSATVEATATPLTLTQPAGVADGDLLIATISSRSTATTAPTATGWTAVNSQNNNNTLTTGSAIGSGAMLYQIRSGTPTLAFTLPTGISVAQGRITAYRGQAATSPLDVSTAVTAAAGTAVSVTGLTTTQDDDLIVAMTAGGQEATWASFTNVTIPLTASGAVDTTTAPSTTAWIKRAETITTSGADTSLGVFDAVRTGTGATGNLTVTASISAGHVVIAGAFRLARSTADAWNDNDKTADITLSNNDKTATGTTTTSYVRSTQTQANEITGKFYAEFRVDVRTSSSATALVPVSSVISTGTNIADVALSSGAIRIDGNPTGVSLGSAFAAGDVVCMAWDAGAEIIWWRKNGGNWNNNSSADPATSANGISISTFPTGNYALRFRGAAAAEAVTIRTELAEYTQSVPSGFTSWMGETPSNFGVTVSATAVTGTGAIGTSVVPQSVNVPVTDVNATGAIGTATATITTSVSTSITSVTGTGAIGDVVVTGKANVVPTEVHGTGAIGTATVTGGVGISTTVTAVTGTGAIGTATVVGKANVSATAVTGTGAIGTATVTGGIGITASATAVTSTGAIGTATVVGKANVSPTSVTGLGASGSVSITAGGSVSVGVGGVQATGSIGTVTVTANQAIGVPVTAVSGGGAIGTASIAGKANVSVTEIHGTGSVGTVVVIASQVINIPVSGVEATGLIGTVTIITEGEVIIPPGSGQRDGDGGRAGARKRRRPKIFTIIVQEAKKLVERPMPLRKKRKKLAKIIAEEVLPEVGGLLASDQLLLELMIRRQLEKIPLGQLHTAAWPQLQEMLMQVITDAEQTAQRLRIEAEDEDDLLLLLTS